MIQGFSSVGGGRFYEMWLQRRFPEVSRAVMLTALQKAQQDQLKLKEPY